MDIDTFARMSFTSWCIIAAVAVLIVGKLVQSFGPRAGCFLSGLVGLLLIVIFVMLLSQT
jgi:hypothetical protein